MRALFHSWFLLFVFFVSFIGFNALMSSNHSVIVGDAKFSSVHDDLPDSRFIPFRTDRLWTSEDIQSWVQAREGKELGEYKLHNAVAFQVFLGIACLQWCLASLLISPRLSGMSKLLFGIPFVMLAVKLVEVVCIAWLLGVFEDPNAAQSAALRAARVLGSIGTTLKVWLTLAWIPLFFFGLAISLIRRPSETETTTAEG